MSVKRVEFVLAVFLLHGQQPVTQVVGIVVQESFLLDKIDEHQPVQHERGVPLLVVLEGNALDELEKRRVFGLEPVVESFGDTVHVERRSCSASHVDNRQILLFFQREFDGGQLLDQRFTGLRAVVGVFTAGGGPAHFAFHPLPHLSVPSRVGEDQNVFVNRARDLPFDLPPRGVVGQHRGIGGGAIVGHHPSLGGNCGQGIFPALDRDTQFTGVVVPTKLLRKEPDEIAIFETPSNPCLVQRHGLIPLRSLP
ncbi:MAG: hypothetical protein GX575_31750 [Candidatus Anammoximicrobium sp.]|nr:hypothetical protein [Candidatus Anammoximicrobium sp.]